MNTSTSCDILVGEGSHGFYASATDPVLRKYESDIKDFGYNSFTVEDIQYSLGAENVKTRFSDLAQILSKSQEIYGFQPSTLFDDSFEFEYFAEDVGLPATD